MWGEQVKNKAVKIFMVLIVAVVAIFGTVAIVNSSKNGWEPSVKETKEPKTKKAAVVAAVSDETVTAEKKNRLKSVCSRSATISYTTEFTSRQRSVQKTAVMIFIRIQKYCLHSGKS